MIEVKDFDLQKAFSGNETFTSSVVDLLGFNTLAVGGLYQTSDESQTSQVITFEFSAEALSNFDFSEVVILLLNQGVSKSIPIRSRFCRYVITNTSSTTLNMRISAQAHDDIHGLVSNDELSQQQLDVLDAIKLDTTALVAKDFATKAEQTSAFGELVNIKNRLTTLTNVNYATKAEQTSAFGELVNIKDRLTTLTNVNYATKAEQTSAFGELVNIKDRLTTLTNVNYATKAEQTSAFGELVNIKNKLTTIDTNSAPVERQTDNSYFTGNLTAGNTTATIDLGVGKDRLSVIQFGGKSDTSNFSFVIEYSNDNITFATDGYEPELTLVGTEYRFNLTRTNICMRFVRLLCINTGNNVVIAYSTIK
jgi:hypothetical protein